MLETNFITLDQTTSEAINSHLASGEYDSPEQVIQAALSLLDQQKSKIEALRKAIQEGIESGIEQDFDFDKFLEEKRIQHAQ